MTRDLDKNLKKEIGAVRYSASNSSKCGFKLESELKFLFLVLVFVCLVLCLGLLVFMESLLFVFSVLCYDACLPLRPGGKVHVV